MFEWDGQASDGLLKRRSYEVTPSSHSHALAPPIKSTNRSKDSRIASGLR